MAEPGSTPAPRTATEAATGNALVAAVAAWLVPGLGHVYLKRWQRGLVFFALVMVSLWVGCSLEGNLYRVIPNQPLSMLATLGSMGMGIPYFILRYGMGYAGAIVSPGYEYGTAFLLTAGLMNLLLVLDAWDIARGVKD